MKKKSNRCIKYCSGRNDFLYNIPYSKYTFPSSCSYKFLVSIVYTTGVMDVIGSCILMYCCSQMLETLREMEDFNDLFPTLIARFSKLFTDIITTNLIGSDNEGLNLNEHQEILQGAILILKISFVLLLGVSIFYIILSTVLFVGIYKKNSACCHIWNVCLCMTIIIYFILAIVIAFFNFFKLSPQLWVMVYSYGFYRFCTIYAVYSFQRKFLFISKANEQAMKYFDD